MKITAVILLIAGIALSLPGGYGYFFSDDYERCRSATAAAEEKLNAARSARGTIAEAALLEETRLETESQEFWCRNAKRTEQWSRLTALGAIAAIIIAGLLLGISRKP